MINHIEAKISDLYIHYIGNRMEEEGIEMCNKSIQLEEGIVQDLLKTYFIDNFKVPEFFNFSNGSGDFVLNPLYNLAANIFDDPESMYEQSQMIAKHLYESSNHANVRGGEMFVAYIQDLLVEDEMVDAIIIFKSEKKERFLQLQVDNADYNILSDLGIHPKKIDKACIIFDTERENGFKLCALTKTANKESAYWKDEFLYIKRRKDTYHQTTDHITATKAFINERLKPIKEIDKTEEAEILLKSHNFFKNNERFDDEAYETKIFNNDEATIGAYQEYKRDFQQANKVELKDKFDISKEAVKKQAKVFKSVLKLDKNFHIYIHGNREMISKGIDEEGNKYYKVFYEEEN